MNSHAPCRIGYVRPSRDANAYREAPMSKRAVLIGINAYQDPNVAGIVHGTDCALTQWVTDGGKRKPQPDCARLAAGGVYEFRVLREASDG